MSRRGQIALEPAGLGPGQSDGADVHRPSRSVRGGHRGIQVWPHIWIAAARRDQGQAAVIAAYVLISGDGDLDTAHRLLPHVQALLAAGPGGYDTTRALTDEMKKWAAPRRARTIQTNAWQAPGLLRWAAVISRRPTSRWPQKTANGAASGRVVAEHARRRRCRRRAREG